MAREGWELGPQRRRGLGWAPPFWGTPAKSRGCRWTPGSLAARDICGGSTASAGGHTGEAEVWAGAQLGPLDSGAYQSCSWADCKA